MKPHSLAIAISTIAIVMSIPTELLGLDSFPTRVLSAIPESGKVDSLNEVVLKIDGSMRFGAFVYMPSLYAVDKYGNIGKEVSACRLMEDSVRERNTLRFKILNPPSSSGRYAFIVRKNSFSIIDGGESISDSIGLSGYSYALKSVNAEGQFINYPVDLNRDTLRILHISNSYGGNLLYYIDNLLKAAKIDVSKLLVERLYYAAGSFKNWYDVYSDRNPNKYRAYKVAGGLEAKLAGGEGNEFDGSKFRMLLGDNLWDLIILNQASSYAPYCEQWITTDEGGYLPELLSVIRRYQPETPIGMLLIHSYAENSVNNCEHWTTSERWEKICSGMEWSKNEYDIDFVVPYGTAIENLRLTRYNNSNDLTGDGVHLSGGLAQYAAGCCYFETVFGQRFNTTVYGNPFLQNNPEIQYSDQYEAGVIPVDDTAAETAQKAALLAKLNMFDIRNPDLADFREYVYGEPLNQEYYSFGYDVSCIKGLNGCSNDPSYCVYGPTGILIGVNLSEEQWMQLPEGFYIRNGEKMFKGY